MSEIVLPIYHTRLTKDIDLALFINKKEQFDELKQLANLSLEKPCWLAPSFNRLFLY